MKDIDAFQLKKEDGEKILAQDHELTVDHFRIEVAMPRHLALGRESGVEIDGGPK